MTVVERVASRIIESDVALLEPDVRAAAQSLLGDEAPQIGRAHV